MSTATSTFSLQAARIELMRRNKTNRTGNPVDILVIVSSFYDVAFVKNKQCLRVVDHTQSAVITISSSHERKIKVGDIIRFNKVGLKRGRLQNPVPTTQSDATAHFYTAPWNDPEAGPSWFCLGHISCSDGAVVNVPDEQDFPNSMLSRREDINRLVDWYLASEEFRLRAPILSQIPHRRRTLEELLACVGSTGEIVAQVMQVVEPPLTFASRKRKLRIPSAPTTMGYAILSAVDSRSNGKSLATLLDPEKRFLSRLRNANDSHCSVRISHVRSQKANQLSLSLFQKLQPGTIKNNDDTVLVLTKESCVTLISNNEQVQHQYDLASQRTPQDSSSSSSSSSLKTAENREGAWRPSSLHLDAYIVAVQKDGFPCLRTPNDPSEVHWDTGALIEALSSSSSKGPKKCFSLVLSSGDDLGKLNATASRSILIRLLGGCTSSTGKTSDAIRRHQVAFFNALIAEQTKLRWELIRNTDCNTWDIKAVTLNEIG